MKLLLAVAALVLAPPVVQAADTDVIHPRAASQTAAPAGEGAARSSWPLVAALGLCAAAGGVMWFRGRQSGAMGTRAAKKLSIAESRPLGNRQHLVVADYAGRKFLLGVCPGRIEMITALDNPEQDDES
ncbi:MAG TPA: flagellar biosynthetic protein FliO [Opitutaceae bacterium]|nr:flagellar biosynthetic protein FliO [Opitutaceae bacterium]